MTNNHYAVHVTKAVEDDLKEFGQYRTNAIQEILVLETEPCAGHTLKGKLKGLRSLEFSLPGGACRTIYKIKDDVHICLVVIVAYHENIYDKFIEVESEKMPPILEKYNLKLR